jgi:non-canonical (house-cleaning) NTP pyrophosphatase
METIRIAVGSKRAPKVKAVREAFDALGPLLHPKSKFEVKGFEVATGVSHTPRSRAELMAGARGRCESLMKVTSARPGTSYFVGLEGGLDVIQENYKEDSRRLVFLESWAFVCDADGRGFYGRSGAILLPEALATEVLDRGAELSQAIDEYTGIGGSAIRKAPGEF